MKLSENQKKALVRFFGVPFLQLNRVLIETWGLQKAGYVCYLADILRYYSDEGKLTDGMFFLRLEDASRELRMPIERLRRYKKELIEDGVLVTKLMGTPPKEYYSLDMVKLERIQKRFMMRRDETLGKTKPMEMQRDNPHEMQRDNPHEMQRDLYKLEQNKLEQNKLDHNSLSDLDRSDNESGNTSYRSTKRERDNTQVAEVNRKGHSPLDSKNTAGRHDSEEETALPRNSHSKPAAKAKLEPYLPLAKKLAGIIRSTKNVKIHAQKLHAWANEIRKLIEYDGIDRGRVEAALEWYSHHIGGEYVPVIESGATLREKFLRLEAAMERVRRRPRLGGNGKASQAYHTPLRKPGERYYENPSKVIQINKDGTTTIIDTGSKVRE